ncbi:MAG TPA: MFS transporter, partial [Verrucomicrobiota bacterium]|nr:MFS transporter [Verrucomicrobiota bacterium]
GVAEWFPQRERALAMGIAIGGASLGAVVAPPLTVWLAKLVGWRGVFLTTGVMGAAWVVGWWLLSRGATTVTEGPAPVERPSFVTLVRRGDVWGLALMRFIFDPVFYFYMFWIPKYLHHERGLSQQQIGDLVWIPFLALGISNAAGGWLSDRLIKRGLSALQARRAIMAAAALVTVASSFAGQVKTVPMALAMMSLLMFAHGFWITNYVTLIGDCFPKSAVATVMGFAGTVGAIGGILANTGTGWIVDKFSYGPLWLASGIMYPLAFVVLLVTIRIHRE